MPLPVVAVVVVCDRCGTRIISLSMGKQHHREFVDGLNEWLLELEELFDANTDRHAEPAIIRLTGH